MQSSKSLSIKYSSNLPLEGVVETHEGRVETRRITNFVWQFRQGPLSINSSVCSWNAEFAMSCDEKMAQVACALLEHKIRGISIPLLVP